MADRVSSVRLHADELALGTQNVPSARCAIIPLTVLAGGREEVMRGMTRRQRRIVLLADTAQQAADWMREQRCDPRTVRLVLDVEGIRGVERGSTVYATGAVADGGDAYWRVMAEAERRGLDIRYLVEGAR